MISPVGISWILSSIIVPFFLVFSRPFSLSDSVLCLFPSHLERSARGKMLNLSPQVLWQILRSGRKKRRLEDYPERCLKSKSVAIRDLCSQKYMHVDHKSLSYMHMKKNALSFRWELSPDAKIQKQEAVIGGFEHWHRDPEPWCYLLLVERHSEASFPSLRPEDVASLVEGSWGGYGAQPCLRWMSHAEDMCLLSYWSVCACMGR